MSQTHDSAEPIREAATIPDLLRQAARSYGTAAALEADGRKPLTYDRLYRFVREFRYAMFGAGLEPGQRIAVAMPAGAEAICVNLAAITAGVALPMNPGLPLEAAAAQLRQSAATVVVGDGEALPAWRAAAAEAGLPFLNVRPDPQLPAGEVTLEATRIDTQRDRTTAPPFLASSIAVVFQTSGTTGEPKRVPLSHANLLASAEAVRQAMELTPEDRFLNVTPHFRVVGLGLVLAALKAGNTIRCTPGFLRAQFLDWAREFEPTWFWAAPAMLRELLPLAQARGAQPCGGRLRVIRTGSASIPGQWLEPLEAAFGVPVVENYGMSEASPQITCNPLDPALRRPGSAGKAAGPEILILGEDGRPAATGMPGEILIQGPNVMAGYEGDADEATFWEDVSGRWFRTGDLGYIDGDGYLYVTGRLKELINRGGEKISPRQAEEVLARHAAIEQVVVFPVPHATLGEEVGAAVVTRPGMDLTEADVRQFAAEWLPLSHLPARVAFVPSLHCRPGEKLQRARLAAELGMTCEPSEAEATAFAAPATAMERELAALWKDILRQPSVGVDDDFFRLGGDSLAVTTLVAAVEDRYGLMRRLHDRADFYQAPTIRSHAAMLERHSRERMQGRKLPVREEALPTGIVDLNRQVRRRREQPPLFVAPFAGMHPFYQRQFAELLAGHQHCYGLDYTKLDAGGPPPETMEQLARCMAELLEAVCPEGPFYLAGHCFGGVLAYEMARQLAARGRRPELLYLVDAPRPGYPHPSRDRQLFLKGMLHHATQWRRYGEFAGAAARHLRKLNAAPLENVGLAAADDPWVRAMRLYRPLPYAGETVVFIARDHPQTGSPLDRRLGWSGIIHPAPEMVYVDGSHLELFNQPFVTELAAVCRQHLPHPDPTLAD